MTGVSRATMRQALGALMSQGILKRVHGQGTFVARPRLEQRMDSAYSFSQQIRAMGYRLDDRLLRHELVEATPEMAALLGVPAGEAFVHIQRLRLLEGVPLMVNRSYTPFALCPGLLHDNFIRSDMCRFRVELGAPPAVLEVRDTGAAQRKKGQ